MKRALAILVVFLLFFSVVSFAAAADKPVLKLDGTTEYELIWADHGSGARMDVSIFAPRLKSGQFLVGHYAERGYDRPREKALVVAVEKDDPKHPALVKPVDFEWIWDDRKSGSDRDVSIWRAVCPKGYSGVGDVANNRHAKPEQLMNVYRCVREDLLARRAESDKLIWNDQKSGARSDVSLFKVNGPNLFVAQGDYNPPVRREVAVP